MRLLFSLSPMILRHSNQLTRKTHYLVSLSRSEASKWSSPDDPCPVGR